MGPNYPFSWPYVSFLKEGMLDPSSASPVPPDFDEDGSDFVFVYHMFTLCTNHYSQLS